MSATSPVRFPDSSSPTVMTRRAWWLVALNFLIPGSAQLLAGNRRLGKVGVSATFAMWGLGIAALLLLWLWRVALFTIVTNLTVLFVAQWILVAYVLLWIVLTLDTLRLVRLVKTSPRARIAIAVLAIVGLVAAGGVAGYGSTIAGSTRGVISAVFDDGEVVPPVNGRYNILLLGADAGPDRVGLRPDSISIASIDAKTGATVMIGIPRNLERIQFVDGSPMYELFPNGYDCGDQCLISYLYTEAQEHPELYPDAEKGGSSAGIEAMRDAAEGVTGLTLQYFVMIDMQGFADLIDALGGITVDVPEDTPLGSAEPGAQPFEIVKAGEQHMNGFTALWYSRTRYESSDFARMTRQRDVQEAILRQFTPANVLTKFEGVAKAGSQIVVTDIPSAMLGVFVDLGAKSRQLDVTRLDIVPPQFDPAYPEYDRITQAIADAIEVASPTKK